MRPVNRSLLVMALLMGTAAINAQTGASAADANSKPAAGSHAANENQPEINPAAEEQIKEGQGKEEPAKDGQAELMPGSLHRPPFVVRLRMLDAGAVPGPLMGILDLQNLKGETLKVTAVTITPYGRLGGLYNQAEVFKGPEFDIENKSWSNPLPVQISEPKVWLTPYQVATAKTGPAEFLVAIRYFVSGQKAIETQNTVVTAVVGTSPLYIFIGGIVGAFLLATFIWASKVVECAKSGTWAAVTARTGDLTIKWTVMAVAYTLNGLIVAIILWVLATGLTTFQLPIAFQLRDFSGGLLAGLFSGILAKSISDKLSLT